MYEWIPHIHHFILFTDLNDVNAPITLPDLLGNITAAAALAIILPVAQSLWKLTQAGRNTGDISGSHFCLKKKKRW
jgi:hypothetical protein